MSRRRRRDGGRRRSAGSSGEGPRSRPTRTFASSLIDFLTGKHGGEASGSGPSRRYQDVRCCAAWYGRGAFGGPIGCPLSQARCPQDEHRSRHFWARGRWPLRAVQRSAVGRCDLAGSWQRLSTSLRSRNHVRRRRSEEPAQCACRGQTTLEDFRQRRGRCSRRCRPGWGGWAEN